MIDVPLTPHGLLFRQDILAHDYDDAAISNALRNDLIRVGHGVYAPKAERYPEELHRLKAIAAWLVDARAGDGDPGGVLSHASAATVLGLDLLNPELTKVHFTKPGSSGNILVTRHTHNAPLYTDEVTVIGGVMVTNLERTAVDVALTSRFPQALAAVDSALHHGADRGLMRSILERSRRKGVRVARRAVEFGDPLAENAGESWSRAQMITAGLRPPTLQRWYDIRGRRWRVDFDWDGRVVGEFDGIKKYTKLLRKGQESSDVVIEEKLREDALTSVGVKVVRWTVNDLRARLMVAMVADELDRLPKVL